jgi:hypothetical protein
MKRCPKCNRQYKDDTLRFCLEDGTPLSAITRDANPPPTEILPSPVPPTQRSSPPTIPSYLSGNAAPQPEPRRSNPILTVGVIAIALLLFALVGIAAYFVIKQSSSNDSTIAARGISPTVSEGSSPTPSRPASATPDNRNQPTPDSPPPLKITASASSVRIAVQANTYYPSNAIDGKRGTAWIEGVDGPGIAEWIRFDFDREINLHRILIQPGYFKSPYIWAQNNRLATVTAQFSDGSSRELKFDDRMEGQKVDVGSIRTRWVRLVIESVYYGTDPDTAISEVAFEWEP